MTNYNRLFIDGDIGSAGQERWSVGIAYAGPTGQTITSPTDLQDWATAAAVVLTGTTYNDVLTMFSTATRILRVRTYYYPGPGPALTTGTANLSSPKAGSGTCNRPPQCAASVSLLTAFAGQSYRGRFYLPWLGGTMDPATLKSSVPLNAPTQLAALLNALGAASPGTVDLEPHVYSPTLDVLTPVSTLRIGDVVDTQRRRRDDLVETYYTAPV